MSGKRSIDRRTRKTRPKGRTIVQSSTIVAMRYVVTFEEVRSN